MTVEYKSDDVLTAARKRVAQVFDSFENVVVSVSGGKDSSVLFHLAIAEAEKRQRRVTAFFLDQEAEYQATIQIIESMMAHPQVVPHWVQVPIWMTNATSNKEYFLYAWGPGETWMRPKHPLAVHEIPKSYPQRFYEFFPWNESQCEKPTAFLVGLRSKESMNRFRAVSSKAAFQGLSWSTKTKKKDVFRFYPIYDWTFGDVWKYIVDHDIVYNQHYDRMFAKHGQDMSKMRVSNLIHEKSFRCLSDLQEFEPDTYARLVQRLSGVHCAALYADEKTIYDVKDLPKQFSSWKAYRDYLLATTPSDQTERFEKRFRGQAGDERTFKSQVKQILINDWENNLPVKKDVRAELRKRWWDRL